MCIIIVCILLVIIVLVQNSKGGGLASTFAGSNQIMGVKKTGDFLERTTWGLAIILFALCLASTAFMPTRGGEQEIENIGDKMQEKVETPVIPATPINEGTATNTAQ
ncbi:preprotein translocase subunit SecG [Balneicella halophila]|uniref:preprotein translocase subunit SecG n=1 Tax=Balneicella halophila TaxID=1537566 RepID=UPI001FB041CE|nr:preprotein translocase subunit SecG [Balneicella halophila]